jgi:hypothetical protein
MTTAVQRRRGTSTEHSTFTGLNGEITVNTTTYTAHIHDGATAGGVPLAKADGSNIVTSSIDINGGTIDGTVIGGTTPAAVTTSSLVATTADINAGTIDGTVIGGTTPAAGTFTTGQFNTSLNVAGSDAALAASIGTDAQRVYITPNGTVINYNASGDSAGSHLFQTGNVNRLNIASNGDISFYEDTGTTAKFFWDASAESLGIGTSSPSTKGHFYSATSMDQLTVDGTGAIEAGINFANGGTTYGQIYFNNVSPYDMSVLQQYLIGSLIFGTNDTERMRIDSSGNLLVGTTSAVTGSVAGGFQVQNNSGTGSTINIGHPSGAASGFSYALFSYDNSIIGSIGQSGTTAVLYNTTSDQRLKENITDANDAGDKIDAIKVRQYDWKADGSHQDYGMVAQELMTVAPEAVSGDPESDEMMGVDYSKLVPMMLKEIQSLRARVAQLEGAN